MRSHEISHGMDDEGGFTLLELLVGLALLALITTLLVGGITAGSRALRTVEREAAEASIGTVQHLLHGLLNEAQPLQPSAQPAAATHLFEGEPQRLVFVSSYTVQGQYQGLYRNELFLDSNGLEMTGATLLLRQALHRTPTPGAVQFLSPPTNITLLKRVQSMELQYYGSENERDAPAWHTDWVHPRRLPGLVAIDLKFLPGAQRSWPRMIVRLQIQN